MTVVSGKQTLGRRDNQEDALKIVFQNEDDPHSDVLMIISDGMGGHVGGEIASNLAIQSFERHFLQNTVNRRPSGRIREALIAANESISTKIANDPSLKGMGCTFLVALKIGNRLIWGSVGDSILFLFRDGALSRLNADHSFYGELKEMVAAGKISQAEADAHPRRNALRSAMIGDPLTLIDVNAVELMPEDIVILATDGVESISDERLANIFRDQNGGDVRGLTSDVLNAVEAAGNPRQDNSTLIVYRQDKMGASTFLQDSRWRFEQKRVHNIIAWAAGGCLLLIAAVLLGYFFMAREPDPVVEPTEYVAPDEGISGNGINKGSIEGLGEDPPPKTDGETPSDEEKPKSDVAPPQTDPKPEGEPDSTAPDTAPEVQPPATEPSIEGEKAAPEETKILFPIESSDERFLREVAPLVWAKPASV